MLWHNGISCDVCLAPMIPANWATLSTSPLASSLAAISVVRRSPTCTVASALAIRVLCALSATSTICALPWALMCVKLLQLRSCCKCCCL
ncbi:hypothetical protein ACLKA7_016663 [Drosophila subpalustris]